MSAEAPMLFAPPLAPVRVEPGAEVTIGRSPDCMLQVPSAGASRRHASVACRDGGVMLRDLGSTNGTFLNGRRIQGEAALQSGDRIRVGGLEILYCCAEAGTAAKEAAAGARTAASFWPDSTGGSEALRGSLDKVPLFAVLQMLEMGRQSGCLAIEASDGEAYLWLDAGRIVHAETPKARGLDAAIALAQSGAGRFDFAPGSPAPEHTLAASVTEIVLEATRLLDEGAGD